MLTTVLCSGCGRNMCVQGGEIPDYPLCEDCKRILEPKHVRFSCSGCPARRACEEADRRGL